MKKKICLSAALALASAVTVLAQEGTPPSPPTVAQMVANRVARLTTLLSLNSSQQSTATMLFTAEETALQGVRAGMKTAHTALQTAIEANDSSAWTTAANTIGTLTAQEVAARATADAGLYLVLNSDQQAKYKQLGPALNGPGGPGGPGHGGPPPPPME